MNCMFHFMEMCDLVTIPSKYNHTVKIVRDALTPDTTNAMTCFTNNSMEVHPSKFHF